MTACSTVVRRPFKVPASGNSSTAKASQSGNSSTFGAKVIKNDALITFEAGNSSTRPGIDPGFVPSNEAELQACLADPQWRICSGFIYKIMVKKPDGEDNSVVPFIPNKAQRRLMARLHHRNIIIKARQLGFTTLVAILWLDHALFNADQRCVIVAQDKDTAGEIFRDKVKLAYERLPDFLLNAFPLKSNSASEIHFAHNNSAIRVSTSARGGTPHRLHISEYGKICAKYPDKAKEVVTGSLPAVPLDGICIIESTAEGAEGDFYDKTKRAIAQAQARTPLTQKDFRLHFYAWWQEPGYRLDTPVILTDKDREYFGMVEGQTGTTLDQQQRNWYVATRDGEFGGDPEKMWQEFPSCIAGDVLVGTPHGIMPIRDAVVDGHIVTAHMVQGVRPVFEVRTKLGYTVRCTNDHPIKTPSGEFVKLVDGLQIGDRITLAAPMLSTVQQFVRWNPVPFVDGRIEITPEFSEFLGMFMGDGSFYKGTMSMACDAGDIDTVEAVESMFNRYLGGGYSRVMGDKKGCIEVRKASINFAEPMLALNIIEYRPQGGLKRKVHVPSYILQSPRDVIAAFLRGLFEADGFAARDGTSIKFFSKYQHVVQDVQLLLLAFGIECRVSSQRKLNKGYEYTGWELVLRANGVRKFANEIGFISKRKQGRANLSLAKKKTGCAVIFDWADEIVSIEPQGMQDVFDITTNTHEFTAGGVVVHNCIMEPFQVSTEGTYYAIQLACARKEGRICHVPHVVGVPVNTFWDIGNSDGTAIWFHQRVGFEDRFINFIEGWGESYSYYVRQMQAMGYVWGTHYLPHDAAHKRQQGHKVASPEDELRELGIGGDWTIVPVVDEVIHGIQKTRDRFGSMFFDAEKCALGLAHLGNYKKTWDKARGAWKIHTPSKIDGHSEAADALRQFAQGYQAPRLIEGKSKSSRNWRVS
jgi:hypothetical protein